MTLPVHLLLPLASSMVYVVAVMLLKRAETFGVGAWRVTFVMHFIMFVIFLPLLAFEGTIPSWTELWKPLVAGALIMTGQVLTFVALEKGDVSIATPVLGLKIVFVAVFAILALGVAVPLQLWLAAGMSVAGIALLHGGKGATHPGRTIALSSAAAVSFALFDVLIQKWSPEWGIGLFLPMTMGAVALYSLALIPFFRGPLRTLPRAAWKWLLLASILMAVQGVALILTLALFGDAPAVNVVYGSRGLWSVLAVWWIGTRMGTRETNLGLRLVGAALMFSALILVVV